MENHQEKNIEKALEEGLESSAIDLTIDYAEMALDSFIDNEIVREIPIVKTIVGLIKGGLKVREVFFAKKLLTFLKEFHSRKIEDSKLSEFQETFKTDQKYRESVIEQILVLNERFLEVEKSKILANLFLAHINEKFSWDSFKDLSVCLNNLHLRGVKLLEDLEKKPEPFYEPLDHGSEEEALLASAGIILRWGTHLRINRHGQFLYIYGIKGDLDYKFPK